MKLAIFDIDGVLAKSSTERAFWRYLLHQGKQGPRQLVSYAVSFFRYLPVAGAHVGKVNKSYLAGLAYPEIEFLGAQFVRQWIPKNWVNAAVTRLNEHQRRGETVVLLSGTLELLARPLAEQLDVRQVIATVLNQRDGVIRSELPVLHPFAFAKLAIAEKLVRELGMGWREVSAYGDSIHDLPLLDAAGNPVAVRPDKRLRKIALDRGWEILDSNNAEQRRTSEKMTPRA